MESVEILTDTASTLQSNIYFPAIPTIAEDLNVSVELVNLTVTAYLIFQGLAPSLWGPISDARGRRTAYFGTLIVLLGACIGLAQTQNYTTLIILRCLQSAGSASTSAIGSGVIGDITTRADRGGYMGFFLGVKLISIAIGPIIGGALAGSLGWRSIFWFLTAYNAFLLVLVVFLVPETLRSVIGNGARAPSQRMARFPLTLYQRYTTVKWDADKVPQQNPAPKRIDVLAPLQILASKMAAPIIIFYSIYFTVWQMCVTSMSALFTARYGLTVTQTGLTFIALGMGSIIGTLITGKIMNRDYRRLQEKYENDASDGRIFPLERARLSPVPVYVSVQCLSILLFGWTVQYPNQVHIAVPIVATFFGGWSTVSVHSNITTYLVDIFHDRSAATAASLNLARCCLAAAGTSAILPMVHGVGAGGAFTICIAVQLVSMIGLGVQWRYGGVWRSMKESECYD